MPVVLSLIHKHTNNNSLLFNRLETDTRRVTANIFYVVSVDIRRILFIVIFTSCISDVKKHYLMYAINNYSRKVAVT